MTYRAIVAAIGLFVLAGCAPQESPTPAPGGTLPGGPAKGGAPNIMTGGGPGGPGGGFAGMSAPPTPEPGAPLQPTPDKDKAIADAENSAFAIEKKVLKTGREIWTLKGGAS